MRGMPEPGAPVVAQHNVFGKSLFGAAPIAPQLQHPLASSSARSSGGANEHDSSNSEQFVLSPIAASGAASSSAATAASFSHISAPLPSPASVAASPFTGPVALPASLPAPITLTTHFEWERIIGRGSYGEVWLAKRRGADGAAAGGERVAIKKHLAPLTSINDRRAFLRRAELLKQICDVYNGRVPAPLPAAPAASGSGSAGGGSTPAPPGSHISPASMSMSFAMRIASEATGPTGTGAGAGSAGSSDSPSNAAAGGLLQPSHSSFGFHSHHSSPQVSPKIRSFNTRKQHALLSLNEPTATGPMPPVSPSSASVSTALAAASTTASAPFVPSTAPYCWPAHLLVHHSIWQENGAAYTVSEHCALGDLFGFFGYNPANLRERSSRKLLQQLPQPMPPQRTQQPDDDESTAASQDSAASSEDESMAGGLPSRRMAVAQFMNHSLATAAAASHQLSTAALTRASSTSSFASLVGSEVPEPSETKVLEERDLWHLLAQISSILAVLHGQSVLHNDVKPDNIYVSRRTIAGTGADEITDMASEPSDPSAAAVAASSSASAAYPFEFKLGDLGSLVNLADWVDGSSDDEGDGAYLAPEILNPGLLQLLAGGSGTAGGSGAAGACTGTAGSSGQSSSRSSFSVAAPSPPSLLHPQSSPLYSPSQSSGGGGWFGSPMSARLNSSGVVPPPVQVTSKVDIYALGSSVYTLVTGTKFKSSALKSQLLPQLADDTATAAAAAAAALSVEPSPTASSHSSGSGDSMSMSELLQSTPLRGGGGGGTMTAGAPRSSFRPASIGTGGVESSATAAAFASGAAGMDVESGGAEESSPEYRTPTHQHSALVPPVLSVVSPSSSAGSSASSSHASTPHHTAALFSGASPSFHRGAATLPASFSHDALAMAMRGGGGAGGLLSPLSAAAAAPAHSPLMPLAPRDRDRASAPSTPRSTPAVRRGALFPPQSSPQPTASTAQQPPIGSSIPVVATAASIKVGSSSALPPPMHTLHSPSHSQTGASSSVVAAASLVAPAPAPLENLVEFDASRDLLRISDPMQAMVRRMLSVQPSNRPSAEELHAWAMRGIEDSSRSCS